MKTVRLKDVAEACGVSASTVSRALNGQGESSEKAALIRKRAEEMGYVPNAAALSLKTNRSNSIGVLYEDHMDHEYFSSLLDSLRREARIKGYDLTLIGGDGETPVNYYEHASRRNLDGVIVIQADFDSAEVIRLATSPIPSVIIDHMYEGCNCVGSDNRASMARLVRHAWEKGHRRIAYSARLIRELTAGKKGATCVFCPDDYSCLGAMWQLKEEGISVPEQLSLIGYDGIRMGQMIPPRLTTYRQDTAGIAAEAVSLLLETIESPETHTARHITVEGRLVEGETVGRPPQ